MTYDNDEDAQFDWDEERLQFTWPGEEEDLEETPSPSRFWVDCSNGLPAIRDRVHDDTIVARFVLLKHADMYRRFREDGWGHGPAYHQVMS